MPNLSYKKKYVAAAAHQVRQRESTDTCVDKAKLVSLDI